MSRPPSTPRPFPQNPNQMILDGQHTQQMQFSTPNTNPQQYNQYMNALQQYMGYFQLAAMGSQTPVPQNNMMQMNNMMRPSPMMMGANSVGTAEISKQLEQIKMELSRPHIDQMTRQRLMQMKVVLEQQILTNAAAQSLSMASTPISMPQKPSMPLGRPPQPRPAAYVNFNRKPSSAQKSFGKSIGNTLQPAKKIATEHGTEPQATHQPQRKTVYLKVGASGGEPAVQAAIDQDKPVLLSKDKVRELVTRIDPRETMDMDVEELFMDLASDFVAELTEISCKLAKNRESNVLQVKDALIPLEKRYNIRVPGFSSDLDRVSGQVGRIEAVKKSHKQRVAEIRKAISDSSRKRKK